MNVWRIEELWPGPITRYVAKYSEEFPGFVGNFAPKHQSVPVDLTRGIRCYVEAIQVGSVRLWYEADSHADTIRSLSEL